MANRLMFSQLMRLSCQLVVLVCVCAHTHKNERILVNEWPLFYCDFEVLPYLEGMPAELIVV